MTGGPLGAPAGAAACMGGGCCWPTEEAGAIKPAVAGGAEGPAAALAMRAVQEMSSGRSCADPSIDGPACVHRT